MMEQFLRFGFTCFCLGISVGLPVGIFVETARRRKEQRDAAKIGDKR